MRTTLTLESDLALQIQEVARDTRRSFKAVVNDAIRRGLTGSPLPEPAFTFQPHAGRLLPGIDERGLNELAWELDTPLALGAGKYQS